MEEIDAVLSWVDGDDPVYQAKLQGFCQTQGFIPYQVVEPTRFQQRDEIYYSLHALQRFAPWIRTIYIITNQQVPAVVNKVQGTPLGKKIIIVDQNELLAEHGITTPIFNSLSVEWLIWRIKGLSNRFIYLNDDFFIIRDVSPEDFFQEQYLVLRGAWKMQAEQRITYLAKQKIATWLGRTVSVKTNPHRVWQERSAQLAGWRRRFYLLPHAPFPLFKTTFDAYVSQHPELFIQQASRPFRHPDHVSSIPLMVHLEINQQRVIYNHQLQSVMVNAVCHDFRKIKARLRRAHQHKQVAFVCMQSLDQASPAVLAFMLDWLKQHIEGTS